VAAKEVMDAPIASSAAVDNTATNFVCFLIINALSFFFLKYFLKFLFLHYELIILRIRKIINSFFAFFAFSTKLCNIDNSIRRKLTSSITRT
uniref:hypothetical protein n=1 Tax=Enterocloster clostridioformis TaxID=1531 RepID=UPI00332135B7